MFGEGGGFWLWMLSGLGLLPQAVEPDGGGWGLLAHEANILKSCQPKAVRAVSQQLWGHQPSPLELGGLSLAPGRRDTDLLVALRRAASFPHRWLTWPLCTMNAGLQPLGGRIGGGHQS